jgi:hypothetical protein
MASFFSAKGAIHTSLSRRPRTRKGRQIVSRANGPTYPERFPAAGRELPRARWIGPLVVPDPWGPSCLGLRPRLVWIAPLALEDPRPARFMR